LKRYIKVIVAVISTFAVIFGIVFYTSSQNVFSSVEELTDFVKKELEIDDETLSHLAEYQEKDTALFWYVHQNKLNSNYRTYWAAECELLSNGKYRLTDILDPRMYAENIPYVLLMDEYVFLINDPNCYSIVHTDGEGIVLEEVDLSTEATPYVYRFTLHEGTRITTFYDAEGNEIP